MAALTRSRSVPTNVPNEHMIEHYVQRTRGGAGLIISEAILVSQQGTEWQNAPGIWNAEQVAAWKKVVDAVHAEGGAIYAQLWHTGRVAHPDAPEQKLAGIPVYAPSAKAAAGGKFRFIEGVPGYVTPTEVEDPSTLVALFKRGAIHAKEAGFDGIEIHGANGYLVHQFLDSTSNLRTDSWGGSIPNRARFPLEVLKEVVEIFGPNRVGYKVSPGGGYNDMGMPLQETIDTFSYFITESQKLPLAYICLTNYLPGFDATSRGTPHDVVATYRPLITSTLFFLNGGLAPEEAARLIDAGTIDAAQFGWLWIGHPDLAKRIEHGKALDAVVDFKTLYGPDLKGYNDYPEATYA
ncbi:hypothetical protein PLICRDRAFT_40702 [Plicaturopsis crispa FD-325 SS-3]|nr:hypothetical protein PLICRDRAFT_40702 [Plicaturopsis crispa FD-325 SS-3]